MYGPANHRLDPSSRREGRSSCTKSLSPFSTPWPGSPVSRRSWMWPSAPPSGFAGSATVPRPVSLWRRALRQPPAPSVHDPFCGSGGLLFRQAFEHASTSKSSASSTPATQGEAHVRSDLLFERHPGSEPERAAASGREGCCHRTSKDVPKKRSLSWTSGTSTAPPNPSESATTATTWSAAFGWQARSPRRSSLSPRGVLRSLRGVQDASTSSPRRSSGRMPISICRSAG